MLRYHAPVCRIPRIPAAARFRYFRRKPGDRPPEEDSRSVRIQVPDGIATSADRGDLHLGGHRDKERMMKTDISTATRRNWRRLRIDGRKRLTKRANKSRSRRRILPAEYLSDPRHAAFLQEVAQRMRKHKSSLRRVILACAERLLAARNILEKTHVREVLKDFAAEPEPFVSELNLPENEWDLLGLLYQSMLPEGRKNANGTYYTPENIAKSMTEAFDFSHGETFLDPCCGSGSFLLALPCPDPERIYGFEKDPVAVFIAKINLLLKYPEIEFTPHILRMNYLASPHTAGARREMRRRLFDYIATNPPWGALPSGFRNSGVISSNESFSRFFVKAWTQLKENGTIRFLFPESLLNVKNHREIRSFLLNETDLRQITLYEEGFSGVSTKFVDVLCRKNAPQGEISFRDSSGLHKIPAGSFRLTDNFSFLSHDDLAILRRMKEMGRYDLAGSVWALGIVTGDNHNKLKKLPEPGFEPIYTGKEIRRYLLLPPNNYLLFDRAGLQQIAPEGFYRAEEKLVYKFISSRPVFAYDNTKSLFLNSANILIPAVPGMSIKTVLAFLNSKLFEFFYTRIFGEVKMLKGNLARLPFPAITPEQDRRFESLVKRILSGDTEEDEILQNEIFQLYALSPEEIAYIRENTGEKRTEPVERT